MSVTLIFSLHPLHPSVCLLCTATVLGQLGQLFQWAHPLENQRTQKPSFSISSACQADLATVVQLLAAVQADGWAVQWDSRTAAPTCTRLYILLNSYLSLFVPVLSQSNGITLFPCPTDCKPQGTENQSFHKLKNSTLNNISSFSKTR